MAKREEPGIKPVMVSDRKGGQIQMWEAVVDAGLPGDPRHQQRRRFPTKAEARAWRNGILADRARGTHVAPNVLTMRKAVEDWLAGQRVEQTTSEAYTYALVPVVEVLGDTAAQDVKKRDIEALVQRLIAGTTSRGAWAAPTINAMLSRLRAVFDDLQGQGVVIRNPARLVKNVRREDTQKPEKPKRGTFTPEQVRTLLTSVAGTEDEVLCTLSLLGFRRSEIVALRWSSVDLDAGTITVERRAVSTRKGVSEAKKTKSKDSHRTLPLPAQTADVLKAARTRARRDRLAYGTKWRGDADARVFRQPNGSGYAPRSANRRWDEALKAAGLSHIELHGGRHTAATLMHLAGERPAVVAEWLGHASPEVTMRIYTHAQTREVQTAAERFDALYGTQPGAK